ncbi:unnamed protein product, partial [Iphiclides podalirius]
MRAVLRHLDVSQPRVGQYTCHYLRRATQFYRMNGGVRELDLARCPMGGPLCRGDKWSPPKITPAVRANQ